MKKELINVSSTKAQNAKNRREIFTLLQHLHRAKRGANGYIELTLIQVAAAIKPVAHSASAPQVLGFYI